MQLLARLSERCPRLSAQSRLIAATGIAAVVQAVLPAVAQTPGVAAAQPRRFDVAQNDEFDAGGRGGVTLKQPLLGQGAAASRDVVKTVEVKGIGATPEEAQRDAARQAVQQVAGLYIDARRQVESKITDKAVSDIVHEKILSYSNAYITKLDVVHSARQPDGLLVAEAKVSVAVAPLIETLQGNKIPTVAFDTRTAVGQVEVAANEKQGAIDLYADLVKRSADLISLSVGTPKVDTSLQAPPDKSWLTIPVTYTANPEAVRDWRAKFERFASARMKLEMPVGRMALNRSDPAHACAVPVFDAVTGLNHIDLQQRFLGTSIPLGEQGITACFAQERGSSNVGVECFGRAFLKTVQPSRDICQGPDCLSLGDEVRKIGMRFELLDASGEVIDSVSPRFTSFPMLNIAGSTTTPPHGVAGFFNYCAQNQSPFYFFGRYFGAYGDVIVLPKPGDRMRAYANFLLSNDVIARTASLRARVVEN